MSDQDTKPAEGIETPVDKPEAVVNNPDNSDATPDVPKTNGEAEPDAKVQNGEEIKDDGQDAAKVDEGKSTVVAEAPNGEKEKEKESKVGFKGRKWPQIRSPPKEMLKVNRGGCPTRQRSDPSVLPDSDDPKAIRWQVEFYFSDSNLPSDKFLWSKTSGSNNEPVPLSLICSFSRMRRFKPYSAVVEALKTSSFLVLEGAEGQETIRRKEPCEPSQELTLKIDERSTYIKGFGEECKSTQFDIENFVSKFGQINAVRLRRDEESKERVFKGSAFVEWVDEETAHKFYDIKPEPAWQGHPMMIMPKLEYERQKDNSRDSKKRRNHETFSRPVKFNRGSREPKAGRPHYDADNWKKRRDEDQRGGFNNRRGRHDHRGRGRGGRGRGGDRRQNGNDRAKEQESVPQDDGRPKIHTSKEGQKIMEEEQAKLSADGQANGKRGRDEDSTTDAPPAKKAATEEAVAGAA